MGKILKTKINYDEWELPVVGKIRIPFAIMTFIETTKPISYSSGDTNLLCDEICVRTSLNFGQPELKHYGEFGETLVFPSKRKKIINYIEIKTFSVKAHNGSTWRALEDHRIFCLKIASKY